jgi:hypothetical protein
MSMAQVSTLRQRRFEPRIGRHPATLGKAWPRPITDARARADSREAAVPRYDGRCRHLASSVTKPPRPPVGLPADFKTPCWRSTSPTNLALLDQEPGASPRGGGACPPCCACPPCAKQHRRCWIGKRSGGACRVGGKSWKRRRHFQGLATRKLSSQLRGSRKLLIEACAIRSLALPQSAEGHHWIGWSASRCWARR